jgi:excisionase family DNA binding protein
MRQLLLLLPLMLAWLLSGCAPNMSVKDVAEYFGVTPRTVYTMIADRRLKAYKIGYRIIRFRRDEVDAAMTPVEAVTDPFPNVAPKAQRRGGRPRREGRPREAEPPEPIDRAV